MKSADAALAWARAAWEGGRGYDVVAVVVPATVRLEAARGAAAEARRWGAVAVAVPDDGRGAVGNLGGTLAAWRWLRARGLVPSQARILLVHDAGAARRTGLLGAVLPSRGSLRLPDGRDGAGVCLRDLVVRAALPLGASAPAGGVDVLWGGQIVVPARPVEAMSAAPGCALAKLARAPAASPEGRDLTDLGWLRAEDARVLAYARQGAFPDTASWEVWASGGQALADVGSFRTTAGWLDALSAAWDGRKLDLDPDLVAHRVAGRVDVPAAALLAAWPPGPVGVVDVGAEARWWRFRRPAEVAVAAPALLGDPVGRALLGFEPRAQVVAQVRSPGAVVHGGLAVDAPGARVRGGVVVGVAGAEADEAVVVPCPVYGQPPVRAPLRERERPTAWTDALERGRAALSLGSVDAAAIDLLVDAALDPATAAEASAGLLRRLVIPWCDTLRRGDREAVAAVLARAWRRAAEHLPWLQDALADEALPTPAALLARWRGLLAPRPVAGARLRDATIVVLSRVTAGADIGLVTPVVRRLRHHLPGARIVVLGAGRAAPLLAVDGAEVMPLEFDRGGTLAARLDALRAVRATVATLQPAVVITPDSRLDQLATLPVGAPVVYLPLTFAGAPRPLVELAFDALDATFGPGPRPPPAVRVSAARWAWARQVRAALPAERRVVAVKLDVGGDPSKQLPAEAEAALLAQLSGHSVLLDAGFGAAEAAVAQVRATRLGLGSARIPEREVPQGARGAVHEGGLDTWAALAHVADHAVATDSVAGHLAAAELQVEGEGTLAAPSVGVAFRAAPGLGFEVAWRPQGRGAVRVVPADGPPEEVAAQLLRPVRAPELHGPPGSALAGLHRLGLQGGLDDAPVGSSAGRISPWPAWTFGTADVASALAPGAAPVPAPEGGPWPSEAVTSRAAPEALVWRDPRRDLLAVGVARALSAWSGAPPDDPVGLLAWARARLVLDGWTAARLSERLEAPDVSPVARATGFARGPVGVWLPAPAPWPDGGPQLPCHAHPRDVAAAVAGAQVVGLTGPAAAGKTTLGDLVAAYLARSRPVVRLDGDALVRPAAQRWRQAAQRRHTYLRGPAIYDEPALREAIAAARRAEPDGVVVVDHVFLGLDPLTRAMLDALVGVWVPPELRAARKLARDLPDPLRADDLLTDLALKAYEEVSEVWPCVSLDLVLAPDGDPPGAPARRG